MLGSERDLLEVLKAELQFLNGGGYARALGESWRPIYIFEDSPACVNYAHKLLPVPCDHCALIQLVPPEFRSLKSPCRHIALNSDGETLDSLYRYADDRAIETTVRNWLENTIARLEEQERISNVVDPREPLLRETQHEDIALHKSAKCANPACRVPFDWRKGGKFFRFRNSSEQSAQSENCDPTSGMHAVMHYWLCRRCSHRFTLVYHEPTGVVLRISASDITVSDDQSPAER